jgi:leucyl-tRNA synthetase
MPVDQYVGGIEHAVMHLLYARFFTKAIDDLEGLDCREPFENLLAQGMVQLEGEKMSKSKGNVVSPQRIVSEYGADTARLFMMQAAQPERDFDWREEGVRSTNGLLARLKTLVEDTAAERPAGDNGAATRYVADEVAATVAVATEAYDDLSFNVALREVQDLIRTLRQYREFTEPHPETYERGLDAVVRLLAPVTPHLAEELYERLGNDGFVAQADWPTADVDRKAVEKRRRLVENTREDVRQIVTVADIEDPERIDIVVTPGWKFDALRIAVENETDDLLSALMADPDIRAHGDAAADYGQQLRAEREALRLSLPPEREREALEAAGWLLEREFDATVRVVRADEADDDVAAGAEPGRPAIDIDE